MFRVACNLSPVFFLLFILSACQANPTVSPTIIPSPPPNRTTHRNTVSPPTILSATPTVSPSPEFTATKSWTPYPTATKRPTSTQTPTLAPTRTSGPYSPPYTVDELQEWLIQARINDLDPSKIKEELQEAGWGPRIGDPWLEIMNLESEDFWHVLDLDGNGKEEWVFSVVFHRFACGSIGELWIINEKGRFFSWAPKQLDGSWSVPIVVNEADMTGDGLPDLVTVSNDCPLHTIAGMYHILTYQSGKITNVVFLDNWLENFAGITRFTNTLDGPFEGWPSQGISLTLPQHTIKDVTGDELPDLLLEGGNFLSMGAGLVQGRQEVWAWDGKAISLQNVTWEKSNERFHVLFEANTAFAFDDLDQAAILYKQVVSDPTLDDGVGYASEQENYISARQFAAFRLTLISLIMVDPMDGEKWQLWFHTNYPEARMTEAVDLLIETWLRTKNVGECCSMVTKKYLADPSNNSIESSEFDILTGSLAYSGYGNPQLRVQDVCPLD